MEITAAGSEYRELAMVDPGSMALKRGRSSSPEKKEDAKNPRANPGLDGQSGVAPLKGVRAKTSVRRQAKKKGPVALPGPRPSQVGPSEPCMDLVSFVDGADVDKSAQGGDGLVLVPIGVVGQWAEGPSPGRRKDGSPSGGGRGSPIRSRGIQSVSVKEPGAAGVLSGGEVGGRLVGEAALGGKGDGGGRVGSGESSSPSKSSRKANLGRLAGSACCWGTGGENSLEPGSSGASRGPKGEMRAAVGQAVGSPGKGGKKQVNWEVGGREKQGGRGRDGEAVKGKRGEQSKLGGRGKGPALGLGSHRGGGGSPQGASPGVSPKPHRERSRSPGARQAGGGGLETFSFKAVKHQVSRQPNPRGGDFLSRIQRAIEDSANDVKPEASVGGREGGGALGN